MDKNLLNPLKGLRDVSCDDLSIKKQCISMIENIFIKYGATALDLPIMEHLQLVQNIYGEEFDKLVYTMFNQKNFLRYDLTLGFARYLANNSINTMKRYTIGKVYRRDKPQISKGRYREFTQLDFDIAGPGSPYQEIEILGLVNTIMTRLLDDKFVVRVNDRGILYDLLAKCGIEPDQIQTMCAAIDSYVDSIDILKANLITRGIDDIQATAICDLITKCKQFTTNDTLIEFLGSLCDVSFFKTIIGSLTDNIKNQILIDPFLARGLNYYTGLIYEVTYYDTNVFNSSIAAGGRYDNLVKDIGGCPTPVIGVSFGLDRIVDLLKMINKQPTIEPDKVIYIASIGDGLDKYRFGLQDRLVNAGFVVKTNYMMNPKIKKQLMEAAQIKNIAVCVIIDLDTVNTGVYKVKDMAARTQLNINDDLLIQTLKWYV